MGLKALPPVSPAPSVSATPAPSVSATPRAPGEVAAAPTGAAAAGTRLSDVRTVLTDVDTGVLMQASAGYSSGEVRDSQGAGSTSDEAADGESSTVEISPQDEIAQLKAQLQEKEALLARLQALEVAVGIGKGAQAAADATAEIQPGATGVSDDSTQPGAAAAPETTNRTRAAASDKHSRRIPRQPSTIPEMEVVEGDKLISNFAKRAKRPVSAKSSKIKERSRDRDSALSDEVRSFMSTWRQEREKEIKALIVDKLRRSYLTLTRDDEECKELNMVINSLHQQNQESRGACEDLRHRLRGSFLVRPEEVVFCGPRGAASDFGGSESSPDMRSGSSVRSAGAHLESPEKSMHAPGAFDDLESTGLDQQAMASVHQQAVREILPGAVMALSREPSPGAKQGARPLNHKPSVSNFAARSVSSDSQGETMRESLEERLLTKQRFRHELARALRAHDDNPCVEVLVQCEEPVKLAYKPQPWDRAPADAIRDPEKDLYDVGRFCAKYGNLDAWVRATASAEWTGVVAIISFMHGDSKKNQDMREPGLMLGAPRQENKDQYVIETREDFLSGLQAHESDSTSVVARSSAHQRTSMPWPPDSICQDVMQYRGRPPAVLLKFACMWMGRLVTSRAFRGSMPGASSSLSLTLALFVFNLN